MEKQTRVAEFDIKDILPIVLIIVVAGIGAAFGLQVTGDIKADMTADSLEYNATEDAQVGVSNITSKFGIIGSVVAAAIILGILVRYLYNMFA